MPGDLGVILDCGAGFGAGFLLVEQPPMTRDKQIKKTKNKVNILFMFLPSSLYMMIFLILIYTVILRTLKWQFTIYFLVL